MRQFISSPVLVLGLRLESSSAIPITTFDSQPPEPVPYSDGVFSLAATVPRPGGFFIFELEDQSNPLAALGTGMFKSRISPQRLRPR
jgi:hypothetical protein